VHFAVTEGDGPGPLPGLAAFKEFQRELGDRCEQGPELSHSDLVGSYRLLD
jgi:hypothetical protein